MVIKRMVELIGVFKKSVVFLGKRNDDGMISLCATGFLIRIENIIHLVTAKHVIVNEKSNKINDHQIVVIFNQKNNQ